MLKRDVVSRFSRRTFARLAVAVSAVMMVGTSFAPSSHAEQGDDALKILKAMTDYVSSQKTISATYDTDIEVITDNLQKFSSRVPVKCC